MKYTLSALFLTFALSFPSWAQDAAQIKTNQNISPAELKIIQGFSNLPQEQRKEYAAQMTKAQNLFNQKRIFDTFQALDELDKIFPDHPASLNIRAAAYVEIRSFTKARALFEKALKITPNNQGLLFNIAEIDFVSKQWASAHDRFEKLVLNFPKGQKGMIRLCEFKLLLCKLKLKKVDEAKTLMNKYDEWDDSPFYFYSKAALLYHADKKDEANQEIRNAHIVWGKTKVLVPWQDTLFEFGYIKNIYTDGDEEAENQE